MVDASRELEQLAQTILEKRSSNGAVLPAPAKVHEFINGALSLLFPHHSLGDYRTADDVLAELDRTRGVLEQALAPLAAILPAPVAELSAAFFHQLPDLIDRLRLDARAIFEGDPAAESVDEVIAAYPGFYAIAVYRVAHELYLMGIPLFPRIVSEYAHQKTGVDIHPGARIGKSFFIDHGTSVVIGETTVIGDHVKLYQGVTLGALSVEKRLAKVKRHPTIEDYVVIYANATILGGSTSIGHHSVIGGNVWLTTSIPPYTRVYHKSEMHLSSGSNYEI